MGKSRANDPPLLALNAKPPERTEASGVAKSKSDGGKKEKEVERWRSGRLVEYELIAEFRSGGEKAVQRKCKARGQEVSNKIVWSEGFGKVLVQI